MSFLFGTRPWKMCEYAYTHIYVRTQMRTRERARVRKGCRQVCKEGGSRREGERRICKHTHVCESVCAYVRVSVASCGVV